MARTTYEFDVADEHLSEADALVAEFGSRGEYGSLTVNRDAVLRLALATGLAELRRRQIIAASAIPMAEHVD
jgi:hypothetical protein